MGDNQNWRRNKRDPLVAELIGPGKSAALEVTQINGFEQQVFAGAPTNLSAMYRQAKAFADKPLIVQDDTSHTFDEVFAQAASLASELVRRYDIAKGSRVALVMSNRVEWIVAAIAITSIGAIAALVNSRGAAEEMLRAIDTAQCELVILDAARADIIAASQPDPAWPRIVVGNAVAPMREGRDASYESLIVVQTRIAPQDMAPEDGAVILFTSGTTGFPKGALLSHRAIAHSVSIAAFMGALQDLRFERETGERLPEERRSMATPAVILGPMFHLAGIMPIFRAISLGTTIHIMTKWNADIALDMIERVGMSRLSFVPAMIWDILKSPRATPEMLGKVAYMANGAAALNPALLREIRERMPNCLLSNTYGQTETTAWTCSISGQAYLDNPSSCGWPAPSVQLQIRRDDGTQADVGEPGEIWVSSAGLMSEYVGNPEATAEVLQGGWLASGDIGIEDDHGIITIVDRKKNMVISGGENIYCAEVERVLAEHPDIKDCIAYGVPDERLGEQLQATVVIDPNVTLAEQEIKDFCKDRLAIYKVPREVALITDPLPRTASGKVDRGAFLKDGFSAR